MENIIKKINEKIQDEVYQQGVGIRVVKMDFMALIEDEVLDFIDDNKNLTNYVEDFEVDNKGKIIFYINRKRVIDEHELSRKAFEIQLKQQEEEYWDGRRIEQ